MSRPEYWFRGPNEGPNQQHEEYQADPGTRRFWDDVRKEMSAEWSATWRMRRQLGVTRRGAWPLVARRSSSTYEGITPSCCMKLSESMLSQCSMIWPSRRRRMSTN
jgi:hypothetical protein